MTEIEWSTLRKARDLHVLYRMFDSEGQLLYVGVTGSPATRFADHMTKLWFLCVTDIKVEWYASRADAELAERRAIEAEQPLVNVTKWKPAGWRIPRPLRISRTPTPAELTELPELTEIDSDDGLVTLTEAVSAGIFGRCNVMAVRKRFQRDPAAPSPVRPGYRGGPPHRYDEDALRAFAAKEMGVTVRD